MEKDILLTASNPSQHLPIRIREKSGLAALASLVLRSKRMAIVFHRSIHLHGIKKDDFLSNKKWLQHELCHLDQFRRYGTVRFTFLYLWESLKRGYVKNRFEVEARAFAESNP